MAGFVVGAATGALKAALGKLATVFVSEYKRFRQVPAEIQFLIDELEAMHAFLLKMSEKENPDVQEKAWTKEVREMSYDIEDCIDDFILHVGDGSVTPNDLIDKCKNMLSKAKARRCIARAIEDIKSRVKDVADRNARYRISETSVKKTSNETVDPRALAIFEHASKLKGIDGPKREVIELLTNVEALVESKLQVVSIVGVGGLGKTTLANQVYKELRAQFNCHAFVSVSRNSNPRNVLKNILCQVSNKPHHNIEAWDVQLLIKEIVETLEDNRDVVKNNMDIFKNNRDIVKDNKYTVKNNRYLIVIDDLWDIEIWGIIKCALVDNRKNSKIITTTRMHDVAEACCSGDHDIVYKMKALGYTDARKLFFERIFGSEEKCPAHLIEVSNKILDKCGGLPLAVISISGLLANKPPTVDKWDTVQKSIGRSLGKDPDVKTMMQILSLSYFDLPDQLKSCLLYLSVFPEDSIIDKRCLVRRWTSEGFIRKENGHTLYELGERCFNELINRSLMQVCDTNMYGEVINIKVHDAILDFIVLKSEEENFVTVFGDGYRELDVDNKVRRLSLQGCSQKDVSVLTALNLSHLRSITLTSFNNSVRQPLFLDLHGFRLVEDLVQSTADVKYNNFVKLILSQAFKYLRVLDFQGCTNLKDHHLANIGNLLQLKYLSLCKTKVSVLPDQIHKLQYLETLDLKKSNVKLLPPGIVQLPRLVHLLFNRDVVLPSRIGKMTALEELECVDVFLQSLEFTQELGQLTDLRNISIYLCHDHRKNVAFEEGPYRKYIDNIVSSFCKLSHLSSLSIDIEPWCEADICLDSSGSAPGGIQKLQITRGFISKVPNWVGYLINLQLLTLYVREFKVEDIMAIGHLPALVFMCLMAHESFQGRVFSISGSDGFHYLKTFMFGCAIPVTFKSGAMPNLENLTLMFNSLRTSQQLSTNGDFRFGIQHLSNLKTVLMGLHLSCDAIQSWIAEKRTQMLNLSCEVAADKLMAEIDATALYVGMGTEGAIRTAVLVHPKSPTIEIRHITQWNANDMREYNEHTYLGPNMDAYNRIRFPTPYSFELQAKNYFAMRYFRGTVQDLKKQERIRRCKLKIKLNNHSLTRISGNDLHSGEQPSQPAVIQLAPTPYLPPTSNDQNGLRNIHAEELWRRYGHRRPRRQQKPPTVTTASAPRKRKATASIEWMLPCKDRRARKRMKHRLMFLQQ